MKRKLRVHRKVYTTEVEDLLARLEAAQRKIEELEDQAITDAYTISALQSDMHTLLIENQYLRGTSVKWTDTTSSSSVTTRWFESASNACDISTNMYYSSQSD